MLGYGFGFKMFWGLGFRVWGVGLKATKSLCGLDLGLKVYTCIGF